MTAAEMHTAVKLGLDKTSSLDIPAYESEEIDLWLNIAQDRFIKQRMSDFEHGSKRISDLRQLVTTEETAIDPFTAVTKYPNTTSIDLDAKLNETFMYYISSRSKVTRTNPVITADYVDNVMIEHINIDKFTSTGFNSPRFKNPVCWIEDDYIYIMHDDLTTEYEDAAWKFIITFIREPDVIKEPATTVPCELDDSTHQEIVDIAVNLMIENIESPRFWTNLEKLKTQE